MAKKIVRGITDVKTITNQDFDTNNVNDLLSDGQYNYIHRKKGKTEEYHNLTDNIKTISSDNTELLAVTNNNKTTNTATLHPKHDSQKEQVIESTRDTITINHGTNGTAEKTTVDTNPKKVLEHENLKTGDGLTTSFNTDETTIMFKATKKPPETNLNTLGEGVIRGKGFSIDQVPNGNQVNSAAYVTMNISETDKFQLYIRESTLTQGKVILASRFLKPQGNTEWLPWSVDSNELTQKLAQKQDKLTAGDGITIEGQTISASGGAHDSQKEQVIESTRNTVTIHHGTNGTAEKTTVDTNPQKVLEHENLLTVDGISKVTEGNVTTIGLKTIDNYSGDLNELTDTCLVRPTHDAVNLPSLGEGILTVVKIGDTVSQKYHAHSNEVFTRFGTYLQGEWVWTQWTGGGSAPV